MSNRNIILAAAGGAPSGPVDPYFNQTTLLLHGDGTNGAQNNTFLDSSSNTFTITRNGNTTQGTFSPFSVADGTWSNYFDGTANGSLRADSSTDTDLSGDFTVQAWVYPTANSQASNSEIISRGAATTLNGWRLGLVTSTTRPFFGINYAGTGATVYTASSTNIPLNQWTHIAVTRSGNTVVIYINGVADTTNTGFTGTPTVSGTEYVYVGRGSYNTTNRQFTGYVNNASIIKGTALTTFNTTTPLATGTSGQSLLTCTANRFVDTNTATTAKALTVGSGASVQPFSPFAPSAAYSPSVNGGSGYWDNSGDSLVVANSSSFAFGTGDFTVEFFYRGIDTSRNFSLPSGGTTGYWSLILLNGTLYWQSAYNSTNKLTASAASIVNQAWNHVAVVRDSGTLRFFFNGVSVASTSDTTDYNGIAGTRTINAGNNAAGSYLSSYRIVKGTAIYPGSTSFTPPTAPLTAVSGTELLLNFTNAGILDNTGKNNLETVGNAQVDTSVVKYGTGSMKFDGTGDVLTMKETGGIFTFGTGDYTYECWIYTTTGATTQKTIFGRANTGNVAVPYIYLVNSTGVLSLYYSATVVSSTTAIAQNTWTHIAVCRASGTSRLFINGVLDGSAADTTSLISPDILTIGGSGVAAANPFIGYIDDVRITKGVARYTTTFTPPTAPFLDQ